MYKNYQLIYFYNKSLPNLSANSIHVTNMCEALSTIVKSVILITCKNYGSKIEDDIYSFYSVKPCFKVLSYRVVPYFVSLQCLIKTIFKFKFNRDFIAYTRIPSSAFFSCLLYIPTIFEMHHLCLTRKEKFILFILNLLPSLQTVVVISNALKKDLKKNKLFTKKKIVIAHDGVNLEQFKTNPQQIQNTASILPLKPAIGFVGSLHPDRGIQTLLDAHDDSYNIYVIGGNPEKYLEYFKNNYRNPQIFFLGQKKQSEVFFYLKQFDILVAPYIDKNQRGAKNFVLNTNKYMSPLKIFEYMAAEKPMIVSDFSVLREIVSEKESLFFSPGNSADLKNKIIFLINNPHICKKLAQSASQKVNQYSWHLRCSRILENAI